MKNRSLPLLCLAATLSVTAGCASTRTLRVAAGNTAHGERQADGTTVLRSEKKHTVVVTPIATRFSNELRELPSFSVMVTNGGAEALRFGPDNVLVTSDGATVRMLTAEMTKQRMVA